MMERFLQVSSGVDVPVARDTLLFQRLLFSKC